MFFARCLQNRGVAANIDARDNPRPWRPHSARRPDSPQARTRTMRISMRQPTKRRFPNQISGMPATFGRLLPRPRAYRRKMSRNFISKSSLLQGRLDTARFDHRGGTSHGHDLGRLLVWKHQSFRGLPSDTPLMDKPGSLLSLRRAVFDWLGAYSFVLRLSKHERRMLNDTELALHHFTAIIALPSAKFGRCPPLLIFITMCTWS